MLGHSSKDFNSNWHLRAYIQWQWKMHWLSQRRPSPHSTHCPGVPLELLMVPGEQSYSGPGIFTRVWLQTIRHGCTLNPCSHYFQVSVIGDWGSCTCFLVAVISSQLLSSRHELPRCTKAPPCTAVQSHRNGGAQRDFPALPYNTSHTL